MIEAAGSFGPILLGLGGLGALLALAFTGLGFTGRRAPLVAWLLAPFLVLAAGAFGSLSATGTVSDTLGAGGVDSIFGVANSGLAEALGPRALAHWIVAALCAVSVWGAGIGALIRPNGETRTTPFVAILGILLSIGAGGGAAFYAIGAGLGTNALAAIGITVFAGFGASLTAFRRALHEASYRVAGLRFTSGVLTVFAGFHAAKALQLGGRMGMLTAHEGMAFTDIPSATLTAMTQLAGFEVLGWILFATALAVGLVSFLPESGEVVSKFTLADITVALLFAVFVGGIRIAETQSEAVIADTGRLSPLPVLIADMKSTLPAAIVGGHTTSFDVTIESPPFGDIYRYGSDPNWVRPPVPEGETAPVNPPPAPKLWYRAFEWTGDSWAADTTPMDQTTPNPTYPVLLAAPGQTEAPLIMEALEFAGGSAKILVRASELDLLIDPAVAFSEGQWLDLEVTDTVDFETEAYVLAERGQVYNGVARFYGEQAEEKRLIHRLDGMFDQTEIRTLRGVLGERTRLDHLVTMCLAGRFDPAFEPLLDEDEEEPTPREEEIGCTIVKDDLDTLIASAVEALGYPEPEGVTINIETEELVPEGSVDAIRRELGAFAWCSEWVQDDMGMTEPIEGRLTGMFPVEEAGTAGYIEWEERRNIDIYDLRACVRERINTVRFPEFEMPEPEPVDPSTVPEGEEVPEPEPLPLPKVTFTIEYR